VKDLGKQVAIGSLTNGINRAFSKGKGTIAYASGRGESERSFSLLEAPGEEDFQLDLTAGSEHSGQLRRTNIRNVRYPSKKFQPVKKKVRDLSLRVKVPFKGWRNVTSKELQTALRMWFAVVDLPRLQRPTFSQGMKVAPGYYKAIYGGMDNADRNKFRRDDDNVSFIASVADAQDIPPDEAAVIILNNFNGNTYDERASQLQAALLAANALRDIEEKKIDWPEPETEVVADPHMAVISGNIQAADKAMQHALVSMFQRMRDGGCIHVAKCKCTHPKTGKERAVKTNFSQIMDALQEEFGPRSRNEKKVAYASGRGSDTQRELARAVYEKVPEKEKIHEISARTGRRIRFKKLANRS
jgi:hypothetical protein